MLLYKYHSNPEKLIGYDKESAVIANMTHDAIGHTYATSVPQQLVELVIDILGGWHNREGLIYLYGMGDSYPSGWQDYTYDINGLSDDEINQFFDDNIEAIGNYFESVGNDIDDEPPLLTDYFEKNGIDFHDNQYAYRILTGLEYMYPYENTEKYINKFYEAFFRDKTDIDVSRAILLGLIYDISKELGHLL